jgi:hypothetical protein
MSHATSAHPLHVLTLSGNDYEMGFQHGAQLKEAIQRGAVPCFAVYIEKLIRQAGGPRLARLLRKGLDYWVGHHLREGFPRHVREHVRGLAEGSETPEALIWQAFIMPDMFLWLAAQGQKIRKPDIAPQLLTQTMGCSSAVAHSGATVHGELLHARNLDYMGAHAWDKEAAVLFCHPDQGLRYLSVTSAGIPLGGVTAMNEAGLTFAVHQHVACLNVKLGGQPVGVIGDEVMRRAQTLKEARLLLDAHCPNSCWTYIVASGPEKAVLCYEVTATERHWFITSAEQFAYTNMYLNPDLAARETHMYPAQWRSNFMRYAHIKHFLAERAGKISPEDMACLLGERVDPRCRLRTPLAMLLTVSSVVFAPEQGIAWVGAGPVPVSTRPYIACNLQTGRIETSWSPLKGRAVPEQEEAAFACYTRGYLAYFNDYDKPSALHELEQACRIQPREAIYAYITGLIALSDKKPELALRYLHQALALGHPDPERVAAFQLWRGRAFDAADHRTAACQDYAAVLNQTADWPIKQAAEKGLKQRWKMRHLAIEFNYADILVP